MKIQLSDHFNYKKLLRFTLPSMLMMIFTSIYGMVDGLCVSNFIGKNALAAINLIMPFPMICAMIGMMLGTGGAALIARTLGRKQQERANRLFTMVVITSALIGLVTTIIGVTFTPRIALLLGANETLLPYCVTYGRIFMLALAPFTLQSIFEVLLVTAERPRLGLAFTVASGLTNVAFDLLFLGFFDMGIEGAAWATFISSLVGGIGPILYFAFPNKSLLQFAKPLWDWRALRKICWNGCSEMVSSISGSVCAIIYNLQLMRLMGEDGVAAYGVIMYIDFIFIAVIGGYLIGLENIIAYHHGAENHDEVKNLRRRSFRLITLFGLITFAAAELFAPLFSRFFVGYDAELMATTTHAFRMYAFAFLVMGFNAFASSLFTALGNGLVSAIISFCRTFVFEILSVLLLPLLLGIDGVWLAFAVGECCCLLISRGFYMKHKERYQY